MCIFYAVLCANNNRNSIRFFNRNAMFDMYSNFWDVLQELQGVNMVTYKDVLIFVVLIMATLVNIETALLAGSLIFPILIKNWNNK